MNEILVESGVPLHIRKKFEAQAWEIPEGQGFKFPKLRSRAWLSLLALTAILLSPVSEIDASECDNDEVAVTIFECPVSKTGQRDKKDGNCRCRPYKYRAGLTWQHLGDTVIVNPDLNDPTLARFSCRPSDSSLITGSFTQCFKARSNSSGSPGCASPMRGVRLQKNRVPPVHIATFRKRSQRHTY